MLAKRQAYAGAPRLLLVLAVLVLLGCLAPSALAAPTGSISGKVTNATTKEPIEGLEVCAFLISNESQEEEVEGSFGCVKTDSHGEYTISSLAAGNFAVVFGGPYAALLESSATKSLNYVMQAFNDKLPPSEPTPVTVSPGSASKEINAEMQEGGEISGTITSASTGAAMEGALACALSTSGSNGPELVACARSGANGEYTIEGIPDGEFDLLFAGRGVAQQFYPGKTSQTEATAVSIAHPKEIKTGINAAMQPRAPQPPITGGPESPPPGSPESGLPGAGNPLTGPLAGPPPPVSLTSPMISVEHRAVALVKLACTGTSSCRGKLILSLKRVMRRRGKTTTWTVPLGAERYSLRHGGNTTVRIRLDNHARILLGSARGLLDARLEITLHTSPSSRAELQRIVLVDRKTTAGH